MKDNTELPQEMVTFINDNIISKGYTQSFFLDYIHTFSSQKDIKDWTIDELTNTLPDFYIKTPNNYIKEYQCIKLNPTVITNKVLKVELKNPRTIQKSLFETSYVFYELETKEFNWLVNRRYSDFIWLKECLEVLFPGEYVPKLPKKKSGNKRFEENFIEKRMKRLQQFLDELLLNENFKSSEVVVKFLSLSDRVMFEHEMSIDNPDNVSISRTKEMMNVTGTVKVLNIDSENYVSFANRFNSINSYLKENQKDLSSLYKEFKDLEDNLLCAVTNLNNINEILLHLSSMNQKAGLGNHIDQFYDQYAHYFRNWGRIMQKEIDSLKGTTQQYCKDFINKGEIYLSLFKKQEDLINDYNDKKSELLKKKERLWNEKNTMKWEMISDYSIDPVKLLQDRNYAFEKMCYQNTIDVNDMCLQLGYFFNANNEHFFDFKTKFTNDLKVSINKFSEEFGNAISDELEIWTTMKSKLDEI